MTSIVFQGFGPHIRISTKSKATPVIGIVRKDSTIKQVPLTDEVTEVSFKSVA